ncbi:MAG: D-glycero-beta-D-manno-heptose 1-phosphate adenylyltransferase [Oligoflexales bacterium]|nr:D-glycero-beta-D-manno-heptose 1-phosphate adenylyltransferase [Oligoflexales bacterium]
MLPWLVHKSLKKIAVIGDIILDEYLEGEVSRISPEAPVPIHRVSKQLYSAGGAANTARNVQLAGAEAYLYSVWGNDESARNLRGILTADEINVDGVLTVPDRPTIKKTRITAGHQQMLRVDWEEAQAIDQNAQDQIWSNLVSQGFDAILLSDYGKGALPTSFLERVFEYAQDQGILTIVDPKGKDFTKYQGCDLITPNRKEACEALGIDIEDAPKASDLGRLLKRKYQLKNVLVTLGSEGMVLFTEKENQAPIFHKPVAKEVFDVSGAGDTVAALMALSFAAKVDYEQSVQLASLGAGIVVEKWGTQPILRHELEQAFAAPEAEEAKISGVRKVVELDTLLAILPALKRKKRKVVFTNGCFDLFHAGHLAYLEKARSLGDVLIVGVNTDESVRGLKGSKRPYVDVMNRMKLLAGLSCVSFVTSFGEATPLNLIKAIAPDILVKGADYKVDQIVGADSVIENGGQVQTIEFLDGFSSSHLIEKIQKSEA